MPRPPKDTEIEGLQELRKIAECDPMKALDAFVGKVVRVDDAPDDDQEDFRAKESAEPSRVSVSR